MTTGLQYTVRPVLTITFAFLPLLCALTGCASIVDSGPQTVTVTSIPSAAKLTVYDLRKDEAIINATTPHTASLERGAGYFKNARYKAVIEKAGYETQEVEIVGVVNGWYVGNVLFGGLIGWLIVDPLTGAMWRLSPRDVQADLTKKLSISQPEQGLVILLKEKLYEFPELLEKLQPVSLALEKYREA